MKILKEIAKLVHSNQRFLITAHSRPDGDSLGSAMALCLGLRSIGKTADVINADPCPRNYASLPGISEVRIGSEFKGEYDILFVLECNNLERTGVSGLEPLRAINIDHHPKNDCFGDVNWVDPGAAAVGEMIFRLLQSLEIKITRDMATNLYVAILTDTGSFQFANTREETFRMAADLVSSGADPAKIAQRVLSNQSESRLRLLARVLRTLDFDPSRRIAWIHLDRQMLQETGATASDTEGIVNYPLSVESVTVCAFFREETNNSFRVSLRSKDGSDVSSVAEKFGGGGHRNAAGLSATGTLDQVKKQVIRSLRSLLS